VLFQVPFPYFGFPPPSYLKIPNWGIYRKTSLSNDFEEMFFRKIFFKKKLFYFSQTFLSLNILSLI